MSPALSESEKDWELIAIAAMRQKLDGFDKRLDDLRDAFQERLDGQREENIKRFDKLEHAHEEWTKKEYAANLVARLMLRLVRLIWYALFAFTAYVFANLAKFRAMIEAWK